MGLDDFYAKASFGSLYSVVLWGGFWGFEFLLSEIEEEMELMSFYFCVGDFCIIGFWIGDWNFLLVAETWRKYKTKEEIKKKN